MSPGAATAARPARPVAEGSTTAPTTDATSTAIGCVSNSQRVNCSTLVRQWRRPNEIGHAAVAVRRRRAVVRPLKCRHENVRPQRDRRPRSAGGHVVVACRALRRRKHENPDRQRQQVGADQECQSARRTSADRGPRMADSAAFGVRRSALSARGLWPMASVAPLPMRRLPACRTSAPRVTSGRPDSRRAGLPPRRPRPSARLRGPGR